MITALKISVKVSSEYPLNKTVIRPIIRTVQSKLKKSSTTQLTLSLSVSAKKSVISENETL